MAGVIGWALAALLVSWLVAHWVLRHAVRLGLVQHPNQRSSHARPTPAGGGLGMVVAGTGVGLALAVQYGRWELAAVAVLGALLAAAGWRDDRQPVSATVRLGIQVGVVAALVALAGGRLPPLDLGGVLRVEGLPLACLVVLAGVWWINLFNFMDGIDGLAGTQAMTMLVAAAAISFWLAGGHPVGPLWIWLWAVAAAVTGFLLLNWPPARLFMGDVGSTWLACMVFALALLLMLEGGLGYAPWVILAAPFVVDATLTLLIRMLRGERWHEAHRSHVYQRLARRWGGTPGGHLRATIALLMIMTLWAVPLAAAAARYPGSAAMWTFLAYGPLVLMAIALGAGKQDEY